MPKSVECELLVHTFVFHLLKDLPLLRLMCPPDYWNFFHGSNPPEYRIISFKFQLPQSFISYKLSEPLLSHFEMRILGSIILKIEAFCLTRGMQQCLETFSVVTPEECYQLLVSRG